MVLKNASVLSCLLPTRFGFGSSHRPDPRSEERHAKELVVHGRPADPDSDLFRGNALPSRPPTGPAFRASDLPRARANTAPSDLFSAHILTPSGDIGESPNPLHRPYASPARTKRSSFTTFFAFSSKRKSPHSASVLHLPQLQRDLLAAPQPVPGRWLSDGSHTEVHVINSSSIPSPLRADDEEYYFSYYTSLTPAFPSHPTSHPDATDVSPSEPLSLRQQDLNGNPDLDSQPSSPVDSHPSHTLIQHPYAYSTPLYLRPSPQTIDTVPPLRHVASQPLRHYPHHLSSDVNPRLARRGTSSSQTGHQVSKSHPHPSQPQLKTSISTPNLYSAAASVGTRSIAKKRPPTGSRERWLSAETWWDALLSPSPRFKVKQAPRSHTATSRVARDPVSTPVEGEPNRVLGTTFPSVPASRPRAVSATSNARPTLPALTRSRSTADLSQQPTSAIPRAGFELGLETLVDERTPTPDHVLAGDAELSLPEPSISLAQVVDEGMAFEQQRAQWKRQASRSIGNRRTRSLSRARSKSLGERQVHSHGASEGSKTQFNIEFLTARSLLGSQSTMPTVHVIKPSNSSSHSKAHSHSHSHSRSAQSYTHASHSRSYSHSHSHSHSLTTSNSSKSSRNPRSHSRNGSWSRTALLKAGALCGIVQDESFSATADEKVPSSSKVDVQGTIHPTDAGGVLGTSKVSPPPNVPLDEVGIAITSSPPSEDSLGLTTPSHSYVSGHRHQHGDQDKSSSSKHTHWSSEYAGPHPSTIDSNLPKPNFVSNVSLRHRLPPRATIHPPIAPIIHPFRTASGQPERVGDRAGEGAGLAMTQGDVVSESNAERTLYPHISLSHADFEQYGVGEALVYASLPRPDGVSETRTADMNSDTIVELWPPDEQSPSCEIVVSQHEGSDSVPMAMNNPPSLTSSTIQMVMSAFNNPDDLDEFQDLFYKPRPASGDQRQGSTATLNQVPIDVRSSASSSPLTHLVRKLSEEAHSLRDASRMSSDPMRLQGGESQDYSSGENETKFVFTNLPPLSSSPPSMASSSQIHVPIQEGTESSTQPTTVIPEDINSSYAVSVLESPSTERENDTFGCPIRHGQFEAVTAPSPIQTSIRLSTHLSIQEDAPDTDETAFLSPVAKRDPGLSTADAMRSSYVTTSDMSHMSGLFDFPLPPSTRPGTAAGHASLLQADIEATPSEAEPDESNEHHEDGPEMERADRRMDGEEDQEPSGDVKETLHALRTPRVASYESQMTFGGSDDLDFIAQLLQARP